MPGKRFQPGSFAGMIRWNCGECRKQFTVRVGTVFESAHIPLHKWLQAVHLMASSKKGISAHQLHPTLEITYSRLSSWLTASARRDGELSPSEKHLHHYLAEFDFRYSNRVALGVDDQECAERTIKGTTG
jgi:transposase-like protein